MRFSQAWDYLLWCDPSNYGGVKCKVNKGPEKPLKESNGLSDDDEEEDRDEDEEDEDEGPEIEMQWNLASYLPEAGACQKNFSTVVAGYITANYQFLQVSREKEYRTVVDSRFALQSKNSIY